MPYKAPFLTMKGPKGDGAHAGQVEDLRFNPQHFQLKDFQLAGDVKD